MHHLGKSGEDQTSNNLDTGPALKTGMYAWAGGVAKAAKNMLSLHVLIPI